MTDLFYFLRFLQKSIAPCPLNWLDHPDPRAHTCTPPIQSTSQSTHMHPALPAATEFFAPDPREHTCTPPTQQPESCLVQCPADTHAPHPPNQPHSCVVQCPADTHAPHPPSSLTVLWCSPQGTHMHPAHLCFLAFQMESGTDNCEAAGWARCTSPHPDIVVCSKPQATHMHPAHPISLTDVCF